MKLLLMITAIAMASPLAAQVPAQPEPARLAKAQEMMGAMRIEDTMQKTLDAVLGQSMNATTSQALAALPANGGLKDDPEFKAILGRHLDRVSTAMSAQFRATMPELIREMTAIYARNFSIAELDDITRFYQSSTGQIFLERTPDLSRETAIATQKILLPRVMAAMPDLTRQMTAEIAAWASKRAPSANR